MYVTGTEYWWMKNNEWDNQQRVRFFENNTINTYPYLKLCFFKDNRRSVSLFMYALYHNIYKRAIKIVYLLIKTEQ